MKRFKPGATVYRWLYFGPGEPTVHTTSPALRDGWVLRRYKVKRELETGTVLVCEGVMLAEWLHVSRHAARRAMQRFAERGYA